MELGSPEQFEGYAIIGRGYGYPNCCVAWWIAGMDYRVPYSPEVIEDEWEKTCFVPCPECRKRPMADVVSQIKMRRCMHTPFPIDPEQSISTKEMARMFSLGEWADVYAIASTAIATVDKYAKQEGTECHE